MRVERGGEFIRNDEFHRSKTEVNNYQINKKEGQKSVNYNFEERSLVERKWRTMDCGTIIIKFDENM